MTEQHGSGSHAVQFASGLSSRYVANPSQAGRLPANWAAGPGVAASSAVTPVQADRRGPQQVRRRSAKPGNAPGFEASHRAVRGSC